MSTDTSRVYNIKAKKAIGSMRKIRNVAGPHASYRVFARTGAPCREHAAKRDAVEKVASGRVLLSYETIAMRVGRNRRNVLRHVRRNYRLATVVPWGPRRFRTESRRPGCSETIKHRNTGSGHGRAGKTPTDSSASAVSNGVVWRRWF